MRIKPIFQEDKEIGGNWLLIKKGLWASAYDIKDNRYHIRRMQTKGLRKIIRIIKQDM